MYFIDNFYYHGEVIDSSILISKVNLDELNDNRVKLCLKPFLSDVKIVRKVYDDHETLIETKTLKCFDIDCFYDSEHDRIEIVMGTDFDKFIYNICVFLKIGRVSLIDNIDKLQNIFAINSSYVSTLILSLEEFKLLNGFAGHFDIRGISVEFIGMRISLKHLFENMCDDFVRPDGKKEYLLRGEKLFKWD